MIPQSDLPSFEGTERLIQTVKHVVERGTLDVITNLKKRDRLRIDESHGIFLCGGQATILESRWLLEHTKSRSDSPLISNDVIVSAVTVAATIFSAVIWIPLGCSHLHP
jgi:hypothetical protein